MQDEQGIGRWSKNGDGNFDRCAITNLTTAGAGTILAALLNTGIIFRTGPTGAVADTVDTGANMDAAFPNLVVGDALRVKYINNVAFALTITAATGITLKTAAALNAIAASTCRELFFIKTGVATYDLYVM